MCFDYWGVIIGINYQIITGVFTHINDKSESSQMSDVVTQAKPTTKPLIDKILIGDHIRYISSTHSMIVTEVTGDGFRVVEVNPDYQMCRIE